MLYFAFEPEHVGEMDAIATMLNDYGMGRADVVRKIPGYRVESAVLKLAAAPGVTPNETVYAVVEELRRRTSGDQRVAVAEAEGRKAPEHWKVHFPQQEPGRISKRNLGAGFGVIAAKSKSRRAAPAKPLRSVLKGR